jgi:hypothetical protein
MTTIDLLPVCRDAACPQMGQHKHPLAHQLEFWKAPEVCVLLKGGYGSAKTLTATIQGVLLSLTIPGNLGFVGRRTRIKLVDSTLPIYLEVLERSGVEYTERERRDGIPYRIVFPNHSQIVFRDTAKLGRFLGPEYGWAHIDEAQEEPESTFKDLLARLRRPVAAPYRKFMLTTNPPPKTHWIARVFGEDSEPAVKVIVEPTTQQAITFRRMTVSTRVNTHLDASYLAGLIVGHAPAERQRIIEGAYGFFPEGPPVYAPPFVYERHVGQPAWNSRLPLVRAWDFGYRHPAVSWHQVERCERLWAHWHILGELDAERVYAEAFASEHVLPMTERLFPGHLKTLVIDVGDTAGAAFSDKGPGPIIRLSAPPWSLSFRHKRCSIELDPIRQVLGAVCACGKPRVQVHQRCANLIDGFAGGYHMPKNPQVHDKPVKDHFYDDFMDSVRYAWENEVAYEFKDLMVDSPHDASALVLAPSAWLDPPPTPERMAAEIERVSRRPYRR